MRSVVGIGVIAALVAGSPGASAAPARLEPARVQPVSGDTIPDAWKKRTSLRVLPEWPRQNDVVRIFVHCPTAANHAIIGSTAFGLKGSNRLYREVGLGLSDRGLGRRGVLISYYAKLGDHTVGLKCVKATVDHKTRISRSRLISRFDVPLRVRRFRVTQFFD
ncbi:hypothetical protein [Nonomuraea sp. NPDC050643]|uniref:hypothetical protein n=1 Tax=Nonomuraea sp. NPDC050643 TaxID=3155660 RepID=UPI0033C6368F